MEMLIEIWQAIIGFFHIIVRFFQEWLAVFNIESMAAFCRTHLNLNALLHSIWFPFATLAFILLFALKKKMDIAGAIFLGVAALYIAYYTLTIMGHGLSGILTFAIVVMVVAAIGIYFLFIHGD